MHAGQVKGAHPAVVLGMVGDSAVAVEIVEITAAFRIPDMGHPERDYILQQSITMYLN